MNPSPSTRVELEALVALFYPSPAQLGQIEEVQAADMPPGFRKLLAHNQHMTVTVEAHHGCPVDVKVLDKTVTDRHYARKILLLRKTDARVVQFGIMRICLEYLDAAVRAEIEQAEAPLGRILIEHDVLRTIQLESLYRIRPGPNLQSYFDIGPKSMTYGRTALIYTNKEPAVELLEIVTPD